ncbi:MAG: alginate lyase family protein [Pseudomonadota bacterium]
MRDPNLPPDWFLRDEVLLREGLFEAHDFSECPGASSSNDAVRFSSTSGLILKLHPETHDLSKYDRFSLKVVSHTGEDVLVGVTLRHGSEEDSPDHTRPVSLSGGREVLPPGRWEDLRFPRESFGSYGSPKGWTDVREIEIAFTRERTHVGPHDIDVSIAGLWGERRRIPAGPRLTLPGLQAVLAVSLEDIAAYSRGGGSKEGSGKDSSGKRSLEQRIPARRPALPIRSGERSFEPYTGLDIGLSIPAPHSYPVESADEILAGRIMGCPVGLPVAWDSDPHGMQEWTHFLNRHHFMRQLIQGIAATGNPGYVTALDAPAAHWIKSNPVPIGSNGGAGPAWETLSAAWRLREWLWIVGIAWPLEDFTQDTKIAMLRSIWEHARSLTDHRGHPNNWIIVESAALALAGMCFPEFREAEQWFTAGMERLRAEFHRQFFEDGVHFEISPFYHAICLHALLEVKQAAAARGIALPPEFDSPLEKTAEYLAALCRPDFTWPSLNDSQGVFGDYRALMGLAGRVYKRPDFAWVGSEGRQGKPPKDTGRVFPAAGICTMRSRYGRDANFLVFRTGPAGAAHVHWDTLSLDVTALGRPRLVDPGITSYAPDPLTGHYRSAAAHNTILINGKGVDPARMAFQERVKPADKPLHWTSRAGLEIVSGLCTGPWAGTEERCAVIRTVMFVKNEYWLVRDMISGTGSPDVTTCWQFVPGRVDIDHKTCTARFIDARGTGLLVIPLFGTLPYQMEIATGLTVPPRGWISAHGTDLPATSLRYTVEVPMSTTLSWLLIPVFGKAADEVKARRRDEDETVSVEITFGRMHADLISWKSGQIDAKEPRQGMVHEAIHFSRIGIEQSAS